MEEKKEEENEGEKKVLISKTESQLAREARKEERWSKLTVEIRK